MDTRFIESLLLVLETGSIAKAAKAQSITAAALSGRIKTLEQQLNCQLLVRNANEVRPSKICLAMLPQFNALIQSQKELISAAFGTEQNNEINIGCISTALTQFMPKMIKHIKSQMPNAQIFIKPGSSEQLYQYLLNREIDCVITTQPKFKLPKAIYCEQIETQEIMLISKKPFIGNLEDIFTQFPFIAYDQNSWGGKIISQWLNKQSLSSNVLCELDSLETIAQLVDKDLGFSIIPKWRGLDDLKIDICMEPIHTYIDTKLQRNLTFMRHNDSNIANIIRMAETSAKSE